MLSILRTVLNPASYPTLQKQNVMEVPQSSEPVDPRAPLVQIPAVTQVPVVIKE